MRGNLFINCREQKCILRALCKTLRKMGLWQWLSQYNDCNMRMRIWALTPGTPGRGWAPWLMSAMLVLGRQRQEDPWGVLARQSSWLMSSRFSGRSFLKWRWRWCWRDGSVVKSNCCSWRGQKFRCQHHKEAHNCAYSSSKGSDALFWCLWVPVLICTYQPTVTLNFKTL